MSDTDAIEAISHTIRTLREDGTLRLTVDISPIHAQAAFSMFGMPGMPMALVRLTTQAATHSAQTETIAHSDRVTGLALLAVQWCKDPDFWEWMNEATEFMAFHAPYDYEVESEQNASSAIKRWCGISSRKELNTNPEAAEIFNQQIRAPFMVWREKRGGV